VVNTSFDGNKGSKHLCYRILCYHSAHTQLWTFAGYLGRRKCGDWKAEAKRFRYLSNKKR